MLLFVYDRSREIFGNAQETFLSRLKKQTQAPYVRNNLFTSMEEMIHSFFVKLVQNHADIT